MAAAQKIGFANKQSGSLWTSSNANEVKDVVNSHADNIDSLSSSLAASKQDITNLQTSVQEKASQADVEELEGDIDTHDTEIAELKNIVPQVQSATGSGIAIYPGKLYMWSNPLAALTITTFNSHQHNDNGNDYAEEYMLQFTVSGNAFVLTLPSGVIWLDGEAPEWNDGSTYQVSIQNNLAMAAEFPPSS